MPGYFEEAFKVTPGCVVFGSWLRLHTTRHECNAYVYKKEPFWVSDSWVWVLSGPRDSYLKKMIIRSWGYISGVEYVWHRQGAGYDIPQRRENGEKRIKRVQAQAAITCCAASLRPAWDKWDPVSTTLSPKMISVFPCLFLGAKVVP